VVVLRLQINEGRCAFTEHEHVLDLPRCCPISGNPQPESSLSIFYKGQRGFLEVQSLFDYVQTYVGGKDDIRSMEGMIQAIAQDCADILQVDVRAEARLVIEPSQRMILKCYAFPK